MTCRIWIDYKDSYVRLTLHKGVPVEFAEGGATDEGFSYRYRTYLLEDGVVSLCVEDVALDCDGRFDNYLIADWPVGGPTHAAWVGVGRDHNGASVIFDESVQLPDWQHGDASQRDHSAEAMGY